MIKHVKIQNFRSFVEAEVDLQPFSLVVGANGSGKTNFFRFLEKCINLVSGADPQTGYTTWTRHSNNQLTPFSFELTYTTGEKVVGKRNAHQDIFEFLGPMSREKNALIFNLIPEKISTPEKITPNIIVGASGEGTTAVLEMLKSGDREDLFDQIEGHFRKYVPEVEKLSLKTFGEGTKQIQVREKGLTEPLPATELSEGTRIILAILTIIHQEKPPAMVLLEDIDRGLHPRLFEYLAPLLRDIAIRHDINIVATTHNPYLVDAMQDYKDAVIIVEKKEGASTLSTLASRLEGLNYDRIDPDDMPLGQLWFSGLVGGTPVSLSSRAAK